MKKIQVSKIINRIQKWCYRAHRNIMRRFFGKKYAEDIIQDRLDAFRGNLEVWIVRNVFIPIVQFGEKYNGRT